MVRPYWMTRGRIAESGVPEKLAFGRGSTRQDRLRFARKSGDRRTRAEQIQLMKPHTLTNEQRISGARLVA